MMSQPPKSLMLLLLVAGSNFMTISSRGAKCLLPCLGSSLCHLVVFLITMVGCNFVFIVSRGAKYLLPCLG